MPMESWEASPRGESSPQYIARSAMIGWSEWTWVETSVFGSTSFNLMVLRE